MTLMMPWTLLKNYSSSYGNMHAPLKNVLYDQIIVNTGSHQTSLSYIGTVMCNSNYLNLLMQQKPGWHIVRHAIIAQQLQVMLIVTFFFQRVKIIFILEEDKRKHWSRKNLSLNFFLAMQHTHIEQGICQHDK